MGFGFGDADEMGAQESAVETVALSIESARFNENVRNERFSG